MAHTFQGGASVRGSSSSDMADGFTSTLELMFCPKMLQKCRARLAAAITERSDTNAVRLASIHNRALMRGCAHSGKHSEQPVGLRGGK